MGNTKNRISGFLYNFLDKDMHCKIQILVLRKKLLVLSKKLLKTSKLLLVRIVSKIFLVRILVKNFCLGKNSCQEFLFLVRILVLS